MHSISKEDKGYSLHLKRLSQIDKTADFTKTHKYKLGLSTYDTEELWEHFERVSQAVDSTDEGSLLWFMERLVALGFLFVEKKDRRAVLQAQLGQKPVSIISSAVEKIENPQKQEEIKDIHHLELFLKQTASKIDDPEKEMKNIFENGLVPVFSKESISYDELEEKVSPSSGLWNIFYSLKETRNSRSQKIGPEDKIRVFSNYFGVDFQRAFDNASEFKETFVIQDLSLEEIQKAEELQSFDEVVFHRIFPIATALNLKTGNAIVRTLLGAPNGWSRLFNITLSEFQKSEENARYLIYTSDPEQFDNNPQKLQYLAQKVHEYAVQVPTAKYDFISHNWGKYRELLAGRLQSWLSNFLNRLADFETTLSNNDNVLSSLEEDLDLRAVAKGGTDPEEELEQIKELQDTLSNKIEQKIFDETFSVQIAQYNTSVKNLNEGLIKAQNEGLDEDVEVIGNKGSVDDQGSISIRKKLVEPHQEKGYGYKLKSSVVLEEFPKYPRFIGQAKREEKERYRESWQTLVNVAKEGHRFVKHVFSLSESVSEPENWYTTEQRWGLFRKHLNSLLKTAHNIHPRSAQAIYNFLKQYLVDAEDETNLHEERTTFYQSKYSKDRSVYVVPHIKEVSLKQFLTDLDRFWNIENSKNFEEFFELQVPAGSSINSHRQGEILKLYWAVFLQQIEQEIKGIETNQFPYLQNSALGHLVKRSVYRSLIQRLVQAGYGSQIRGSLSLLSRKDFTERITIQNIGSRDRGQSYLQYVPHEVGELSILEDQKQRLAELKGRSDLSDDEKKERSHLKQVLKRAKKRLYKKGDVKYQLEQKKETIRLWKKEIAQQTGNEKVVQFSNAELVSYLWKHYSQSPAFVFSVLADIPHSWYMVLETQEEFTQGTKIEEGFFIDKKEALFTRIPKKSLYKFPIQTRGSQLQFLEKYLRQKAETSFTELFLSTSLVFERKIRPEWQSDKTVEFYPQKDSYALYWAIPWQFKNRQSSKSLKKGELPLQTEYYLGIDLGEYGIGWAIIPKDPEEFQVKDSGFMEFNILPYLRNEVKQWQAQQATGTFSSSSTKIARIREQAIGQIRNRIHALALQYNATPVFETEVDAFETGGNRIKKVYNSVKTSDVGDFNVEADKALMKQIWGVQNRIGREIGASLTSQTCRNCGRCATHTLMKEFLNEEGEFEKYKTIEVNNRIISTQEGDIRCESENETMSYKEVIPQIKSQQRTSTNTGRGSQDWFICQFVDCGAEANADEQAAQNIALKRLIVDEYSDSKQKNTKQLFMEYSSEYAFRNK